MQMHFTRGTSSLFKPDHLERIACAPDEVQDALRDLDGGDHAWWCAGTFATGQKRSKAAWIGTGSLAPLDLDTATTDGKKALPEQRDWFTIMEAVRQGAWPWIVYAHTTPHGVRIVGRLSEAVKDADDYATVVEAMAAEMAGAINSTAFHLDLGSKEPWRAMFAPGARVNGVARVVGLVDHFEPDAEAFDVGAALEARRMPQDRPAPKGSRKIGKASGGTSDTNAARKAWLAANPLPESYTRGTCPLCGHHECFQVDAESRWFCYSTNCGADGPAGVGMVLAEGTRCGDAFDLAMHERGLTDRQLLIEDGHLKADTPPDEAETGKAPILLPGEHWNGAESIVQTQNHFVEEALMAMDEDTLFRRGDLLVTLDQDAAALRRVDTGDMAHMIDEHCHTYRWVKAKGSNPKATYHVVPGALAAQSVASAVRMPFMRPVDNVVRHPVMARTTDDGFRICDEGYDAQARVYTLPHGVEVQDDMDAATGRAVLDDLLVDYPFVTESDRQNAIAMMVTQVCRLSMDTAPLFYVGASKPGTGKTKLIKDTCTMAVTGQPGNGATFKRSEEEVRKYLESVLLSGESFVYLDNVPDDRVLNSASMAAVLTMPNISMRILGETRDSNVRNMLTIAITGNNTRMSSELARRTVPVMLTPLDDKPHLRDGFVHPHAGTYAKQRRALVLSAIVSATTRWQMLGCPEPISAPRMGSFEIWRNVVCGIMEHGLGYDQVMTNHHDFVDRSGDGARSDLDQLVEYFRKQFGTGQSNAKRVATVYGLVDEHDLFIEAMGACRSEDPHRRAVFFRHRVMRPLDGTPTGSAKCFRTDDNGATWWLGDFKATTLAKQMQDANLPA